MIWLSRFDLLFIIAAVQD